MLDAPRNTNAISSPSGPSICILLRFENSPIAKLLAACHTEPVSANVWKAVVWEVDKV